VDLSGVMISYAQKSPSLFEERRGFGEEKLLSIKKSITRERRILPRG